MDSNDPCILDQIFWHACHGLTYLALRSSCPLWNNGQQTCCFRSVAVFTGWGHWSHALPSSVFNLAWDRLRRSHGLH